MKLDFNDICEEMRKIFLPKEVFELRFGPVEKIVYGFTGLILLTVATLLISTVMKR